MQPLFRTLFEILLIVQVILYGVATEPRPFEQSAEQMARYPFYLSVMTMLVIGFAFLMVFLHKNSLTATSHVFLVTSFVMLLAPLTRGFFRRVFKHGEEWNKIQIGLDELITAEFAAAAILISFGAVIGRVTAAQLLLMAGIETILYNFNEALCVHKFGMADAGGSVVIHAFGAFFGLSVAWALNRNAEHKDKDTSDNSSNDISDTMAMIGTLFLWIFWPSFTTGMVDYNTLGMTSVVNTVISLFASTVTAFYICSMVYEEKFRMVEIQNSTLAGGVAVGTCCTMNLGIFGAILIGIIAGIVSVFGYRWLQTYAQEAWGLPDTCGIFHLHGNPGLIGGLASVIGAAVATEESYKYPVTPNTPNGTLLYSVFPARDPASHWGGRTAGHQAMVQLGCIGITLLIAIGSGLLVGFLLHKLPHLAVFFHDYEEFQRMSPTEVDPLNLSKHSSDLSPGANTAGNINSNNSAPAISPGLAAAASGHYGATTSGDYSALHKQNSLLHRAPSLTGSLGREDPMNLLAPRGRLAKRDNHDHHHHHHHHHDDASAPLVQHKNDDEDDVQFS